MDKKIEGIIYAKLSGEALSYEDREYLENWMHDSKNKREYRRLQFLKSRFDIETRISRMDSNKSWVKIDRKLSRSISFKRILSYAAAIVIPLLIIGGAFYVFELKSADEITKISSNIIPGKNQAILTLASGESIALNKINKTLIVNKAGDTIAHKKGNGLVYKKESFKENIESNKVFVPRGGEYQLTLSDGTKVWLNSESELSYPVCFRGKERIIYLKGEAFFKVTKNKEKPFIVISDRQKVKVYGTSFNVKDYENEDFVQTTLTEGSVKVYNKKLNLSSFIKPGEQAVLSKNKLNVRKVNIGQYVSWKDGEFIFQHEKLENIMKKISRWYDVDIFYMNKNVKDYHFTAWFKKDRGIDYVVKQLKATNRLEVRIKNRTIIISDKIR
jgi:ferric-dicitrate binding protein FerR (iron transport regulator)